MIREEQHLYLFSWSEDNVFMTRLTGHCRCGNIQFQLNVSFSSGSFSPRACDCDFCMKNHVSYISDPTGFADIQIQKPELTVHLRQGSETAEFLKCQQCDCVVGVFFHDDEEQMFASFNANLIESEGFFAPKVAVSPKKLNPEQKKQRWRELWFRNIRFSG